MILKGFSVASTAFVESRKAAQNYPTLDIFYSELITSPEAVLAKIYQHADKDLNEEAKQAIAAWQVKNQQHKHGKHHYSLKEFALSEELIKAKCVEYRQSYSNYF